MQPNFIFCTGDKNALGADLGDRRFTVIVDDGKISGNEIDMIIVDELVTAKKPPARKGPTKNRKWWDK